MEVVNHKTAWEEAQEMGSTLRLLRESMGISHRELADLAGVAPLTIGRIESGHVPRLSVLCKLADALGLNLRDLLPATHNESYEVEAMQFAIDDMLNDLGATVAWYRGLMGSRQ
jgi:transcriptional regulator with XRE-family HTH domain